MTTGLLHAALAHARKGRPVFPCNPNWHNKEKFKTPLTTHGFYAATTDEAQIRAWWKNRPAALIGMPTGQASRVFVVDVDNKDGKDGEGALERLQDKHGRLPDTIQAFTPNGGRHIYFRQPPDSYIPCGTCKLGDGLDVRGDGGYVILPPSGMNGHAYAWELSSDPDEMRAAEAPAWLLKLVTGTAPKPGQADATPIDMQEPTAAQWDAIRKLPKFQATWDRERGDLGDHSASGYDLSLANLAAAAGWSDSHIVYLMHAWRSAHGEDTAKPKRADYVAETIRKARETPKQREDSLDKNAAAPLGLDAREFIAAFQPAELVIPPFLPRDSVQAVTAITNHGKTAVTLNVCIDSTLHHGTRGLILCGENVNAFRARLLATVERLGGTADDIADKVRVIPMALALNNHLSQIIAEGNSLNGCDWVLVDTSAAYYSYEDEDNNVMALHHARDLRELTTIKGHPGVLVNCHPTKHANADSLIPRGGGAFLNEIDGNLTCWLQDTLVTLHWQRKLRSDEFDAIPFEIERQPVTLNNQTYWTVVAVRLTDERELELTRKVTETENAVLVALLEKPKGTFEEWRVMAGFKHRSRVQKALERLKDDKLVRRYRGRWVLTEGGRAEAKCVAD